LASWISESVGKPSIGFGRCVPDAPSDVEPDDAEVWLRRGQGNRRERPAAMLRANLLRCKIIAANSPLRRLWEGGGTGRATPGGGCLRASAEVEREFFSFYFDLFLITTRMPQQRVLGANYNTHYSYNIFHEYSA
jgi:hypothetical protein